MQVNSDFIKCWHKIYEKMSRSYSRAEFAEFLFFNSFVFLFFLVLFRFCFALEHF